MIKHSIKYHILSFKALPGTTLKIFSIYLLIFWENAHMKEYICLRNY